MDKGARGLILGTLQGASNTAVLDGLFRDRFSDVADYLLAVEGLWGKEAVQAIRTEVHSVSAVAPMVVSAGEVHRREEAIAEAMLVSMPEADFRSAVFRARVRLANPAETETRIASICKARGIPWEFTLKDGFQWVGDTEVEVRAIGPVMSAITDTRFAGAARSEFEQARTELALGTPAALKQSVVEAAAAIESAMKVLLTEHGKTYEPGETASKILKRLEDAGIIPHSMERIILGVSTVRNKQAGHGAGATPHDVPRETAEAVVASAAVAISYMHDRLP
jgi:hypothetical protein